VGDFADTTTVELAWNQPVTGDALDYVEYLIDKAERLVRDRVPGLDARIAAGCPTEATVGDVVVDMVVRLLRNPEGLSSESAGDYSYQRNAATGEGRIFLRPDELARLLCNSGRVSSVPVGDNALLYPHRRDWRRETDQCRDWIGYP
jgi:hypothetical protein